MSAAKDCPSCGRPIDALRAPVVRVVGGKVVAYCSADCKNGIDKTPLPGPLPEPPDDEPALEPSSRQPATGNRRPATGDLELRDDITPIAAAPPRSTPPTGVPRAPSRRRRAILLAGAVAAAAAGVVVLQRSSSQVVAAATVSAPPAPASAPAPDPLPLPAPAPAPRHPIDRAALYDQARRALSAALGDTSPRVRLLAAMALSRTGDAAALAELDKALTSDESEIRRLEVAYALARARQPSGTTVLVDALRAARRDVRLQAARALAQLGDPRALPRLREAMEVTQLRLGAAETLAALGDEPAKAILKQALASNVAETRMRAAVALGRAGDDSGRKLLQEIVADSRLEIGAEGALARLGDREVVPALTRALGLSALRVPAALELRRLGVEPDLTVLADALVASDEMAKISAAEAALVLCAQEPPVELE